MAKRVERVSVEHRREGVGPMIKGNSKCGNKQPQSKLKKRVKMS